MACYATAEKAKVIDEMDEKDALDLGLKELSVLIGKSVKELEEKCIKRKRVAWGKDPYALGGYAGSISKENV